MATQVDSSVFSAMQTGKPYATFRKTILSLVYVTVLSPFNNQPEGLLLKGEKGSETSMVDVWSEMEYVYFKRMNKKHLETGVVIQVQREDVKEEKIIEQYSDKELEDVINMKYISFQKVLSDITSEAVLFRMLDLAKELEKSAKIIGVIEAKIAELQAKPANLVITQ